MKTGFLKVC